MEQGKASKCEPDVAAPMWRHLQQARWLMDPHPLRDAIDKAIWSKFGTTEVPGVSPLDAYREATND